MSFGGPGWWPEIIKKVLGCAAGLPLRVRLDGLVWGRVELGGQGVKGRPRQTLAVSKGLYGTGWYSGATLGIGFGYLRTVGCGRES